MKTHLLILICLFSFLISCNNATTPVLPVVNVYVQAITINGTTVLSGGSVYNVKTDSVVVHILFSSKIDKSKFDPSKLFISNNIDTSFTILPDTSKSELSFRIKKPLSYYTTYKIELIAGENMEIGRAHV